MQNRSDLANTVHDFEQFNLLLPMYRSNEVVLNEALLVGVQHRAIQVVKALFESFLALGTPNLIAFKYADYMLDSDHSDKKPPYSEEFVTFLHMALIIKDEVILQLLFSYFNLGWSHNCLSLYEFAEKYNFKESLRKAWQDSFPDKQFYSRTDVTLMLETHSEHFPRLLKKEECQHLFWKPARIGYFKGDYPIIHAATLENTEFLRLLLSDKKSQDAALLAKSLYSATRFNRLEAIKILLQHGAKPSFEFYDCGIYSDTNQGVINLFQLVLTKKNIDILKLFLIYCGPFFPTPSYGSVYLFAEKLQLKHFLLDVWAESIVYKSELSPSDSCLMKELSEIKQQEVLLSAVRRNTTWLEYFIQNTARSQSVLDTALLVAVEYNKENTVKLLLQYGAVPNPTIVLNTLVKIPNLLPGLDPKYPELPAMHLALANNYPKILTLFLPRYPLDSRGYLDNLNLYDYAVQNGHELNLINTWLKCIASKETWTAADIYMLLKLCNLEWLKLAITKNPSLVYQPAPIGKFKGSLPIFQAASLSDCGFLEYFLEFNPNWEILEAILVQIILPKFLSRDIRSGLENAHAAGNSNEWKKIISICVFYPKFRENYDNYLRQAYNFARKHSEVMQYLTNRWYNKNRQENSFNLMSDALIIVELEEAISNPLSNAFTGQHLSNWVFLLLKENYIKLSQFLIKAQLLSKEVFFPELIKMSSSNSVSLFITKELSILQKTSLYNVILTNIKEPVINSECLTVTIDMLDPKRQNYLCNKIIEADNGPLLLQLLKEHGQAFESNKALLNLCLYLAIRISDTSIQSSLIDTLLFLNVDLIIDLPHNPDCNPQSFECGHQSGQTYSERTLFFSPVEYQSEAIDSFKIVTDTKRYIAYYNSYQSSKFVRMRKPSEESCTFINSLNSCLKVTKNIIEKANDIKKLIGNFLIKNQDKNILSSDAHKILLEKQFASLREACTVSSDKNHGNSAQNKQG